VDVDNHAAVSSTADAAARQEGQRRWAPLMDGDRAFAARAAVEQILRDSRGWQFSAEGKRGALWGGVPAMALLAGYLAAERSDDCPLAMKACNELVDEGSALAGETERLDLFYGVAGFGWLVSHLSRQLEGLHEYDLGGVDNLVERYLRRLASERPRDRPAHALLEGAIGTGLYALERLPRKPAIRAIGLVLDYLEMTARVDRAGIWWECAFLGKPTTIALGPAHGVSGAIVFLARVHAKRIFGARPAALLEKSVSWLLAQRLPSDGASIFPHPLVGSDRRPSGLSWCHGDPGIAISLYAAASLVGREDWKSAAVRTACHAASRVGEHVIDTAICHGSVGLAHIFNRLFQATGEERLRDAAMRWFDITLERRQEGRGVGGYRIWHDDGLTGRWGSSVSLLLGATGIALTLLAAITDVSPEWDRLFVMSGD
jgi:hypothetical protein